MSADNPFEVDNPHPDARASGGYQRIALALDGSNIGAWEWKISDGRITLMRHWGHSMDYGFGHGSGAGWPDVLHPDERQSILARGRDFLEGRIDSFEFEHRVRSPSGEWRWMLTRGRVVAHDRSGRPTRAVGVHLDITDLKRAQTVARESEERYRTVVESADHTIAVLDENGVFLFVNRHAAERLGGRPEDFAGRTLGDLFAPEVAAELLGHIREAIRTRQGICSETAAVVGGRRRLYSASYQPLIQAAEDRRAVLLTAREITEQRRTQQELTRLNEQLTARANQLRALASELTRAEQRERQRVSGILHDRVQQTLAAAKLRLGMLGALMPAGEGQALAAQVGELLSTAIGAVRTLAVEMSPPVLKDASLTAALGWLADEFWKHHGLQVRVEADPHSDASIDDTRTFLFQAARELLFNVCKHAGVGSAVVRLAVVDGKLELSVADAGAGFDPSDTADRTSGRLGLFGIRERLQALGGSLDIDAAPGRGTRVTLTVPAGAGAL